MCVLCMREHECVRDQRERMQARARPEGAPEDWLVDTVEHGVDGGELFVGVEHAQQPPQGG